MHKVDPRLYEFIYRASALIVRGHPPEINPFKAVASDYPDKRYASMAKNFITNIPQIGLSWSTASRLWDELMPYISKIVKPGEVVDIRFRKRSGYRKEIERILRCPFCGIEVPEYEITKHMKSHASQILREVLEMRRKRRLLRAGSSEVR